MDAGLMVFMILYLALLVVIIAGCWKTFAKAGEPGWACIVPIYGTIVFLRIAGKEWWWIFLLLIPLVNLVVAIIVCIEFAKNFGRGPGFGVGIALLGFIFLPILGFGEAEYLGNGSPGRRKKKKKKKKKRRLEEDEPDEDRESARARDDEHDEGFEEERPRRRPRETDEDLGEERPRRRPRDDEDDEPEEYIAPRKRPEGRAAGPRASDAPTSVQCENCGRKLRVPPSVIGKRVKCPGCGEGFVA